MRDGKDGINGNHGNVVPNLQILKALAEFEPHALRQISRARRVGS